MTADTDPITLKDAAQHFGLTVLTLRAEAERGRLTLYKIGKKYYTTRGSVAGLDRTHYNRRNRAHEGSGIYVVGFDSYVKIGWSDDLARRLAALQHGIPVKLTIYASFSCQKYNESILLRRFRKYRTGGEWFRHEGEIAEWVRRGCQI
jgi:hypothetical protein